MEDYNKLDVLDQNGAELENDPIDPDQKTQYRKLNLNEFVSNFAVPNSTPTQLDGIVPKDRMRLNAASIAQPIRYITSYTRHLADKDSCYCSNLSIINRQIMPRILHVPYMDDEISAHIMEILAENVGPVLKMEVDFDSNDYPFKYSIIEFDNPSKAHAAGIFLSKLTLDYRKIIVKFARKVLAKNGKWYWITHYLERLEGESTDDSLKIASSYENMGIHTSNADIGTSNLPTPQMLHIKKNYQRNAAKESMETLYVRNVVESLSGLYKSYCSICLLDMTARDAFCCYEKGQDIRTALRNIYNMKKNVTDSNRDEFSEEFKKIQRMILKESKKILNTIPDNFAISNSSPSLLELVPPRILIEPRIRVETNFGMQLNAAPKTGKQNAKINELQITPQGSSEVSNLPSMPTVCIYVRNLKKKEMEKLISSLYKKFGRIFKPEIIFDSDGDRYAFIKFYRDSDAKNAFLFMNKTMYLEMNIQVSWAKKEINSEGNSYFYVMVDESNEVEITSQDSFDVCNFETKKSKTMQKNDDK